MIGFRPTPARNVMEYRAQARKRLPRAFFEFLDRGVEDEIALANNRAALDRVKLRPRVLVDVHRRDTSTSLFGKPLRSPMVIAPTGVADMMAYRGELALARAAAGAGIPFTLTTSSTVSIEDVAAAATCGFWLQHYLWDQRDASHEVIDRADRAGVDALVVTVDSAVFPNREYNDRNGFASPIRFNLRLAADILAHPRWFATILGRYWMTGGMPRFVNHPQRVGDAIIGARSHRPTSASVTWPDIAALRDRWPRTLILKGIMTAEDAYLAARCGVDAVIVSNHGGRTLDCTPAPIEVLEEVAAAAGGKVAVLFDGGVRRGSDIVKALALGARAVLVGRATLYGVAAAGEPGASHVLALLAEELSRAMGHIGVPSIAEIGPHCVHRTSAMASWLRGTPNLETGL